jgi:2-methylcitrate dehydratase
VACLEQAKEFGGSDGRCTLIGGGQANVVFAAQYNAAVVRYVDFMDSYLGREEICHPSDNLGSILAVCEHAGRSPNNSSPAVMQPALRIHSFM